MIYSRLGRFGLGTGLLPTGSETVQVGFLCCDGILDGKECKDIAVAHHRRVISGEIYDPNCHSCCILHVVIYLVKTSQVSQRFHHTPRSKQVRS